MESCHVFFLGGGAAAQLRIFLANLSLALLELCH